MTHFSGRRAPDFVGEVPHLGNWLMCEAYSHEVSSCGFSPGGTFGEALFYSYPYRARRLLVAGASRARSAL